MTLKLAGKTPAKFEYEEGSFYCSWVISQEDGVEKILDLMGSVIAFMSSRGYTPVEEYAVAKPEKFDPETLRVSADPEIRLPEDDPVAAELAAMQEEPDVVQGIPWAQYSQNPREIGGG